MINGLVQDVDINLFAENSKNLVQKEKEKNRIKRMMESPRYISSYLKKSIDFRLLIVRFTVQCTL